MENNFHTLQRTLPTGYIFPGMPKKKRETNVFLSQFFFFILYFLMYLKETIAEEKERIIPVTPTMSGPLESA